MPPFWRIFWGKFASSHHQYMPLPGPLAPPLSNRPSLKITALSYSWTTLQILLDLQIAINWFWCWPWSRRKGWRAAWQGPSPKRLGWGPARRGRLQTHSRQLRRWDILDIRGERIIRYSNIIRITNIRICIRPQIETRILFVFVFVQKFGSEYHLYSHSVILKIRILFA